MSKSARFMHDDIVKVIKSGETGTVKEVRQSDQGYIYGVKLSTAGGQIDVAEDELELVKIANDDETGFAIRYIS